MEPWFWWIAPFTLVGLGWIVLSHYLPFSQEMKKAPRGCMGWPIVGETMAFLTPHYSNRRGRFLDDRCRRYGKVFKSHLFGSPAIVSCDPELNAFVLRNENRLFECSYPKSIRGILGSSCLLVVVGDVHKRLRSQALNFISAAKSNHDFLMDIERNALLVINSWKDKQTVIFCEESRKFTFNVIVKQTLSLIPDNPLSARILHEFLTFMKGLISVPIYIPGTPYAKAVKARQRIFSSIQMIADERSRQGSDYKPSGDFLDMLLVSDSLKSHEKLSLVLDMLLGGFETTYVLLSIIIQLLGDSQLALQQLKENNKNIIIDEGLDIGYLVHLLDSNISTIRENSVIAVSILAKSDACKPCLVGEGVNVIAPLIRLLESGTSVANEKAAEALLGLTVVSWEPNHIDRENAWAVSAYGGLSPLVKICRQGSLELQAIGSAVLRNLAFVEHIRGPLAEEGAIPVLINLVKSGTPLAQESSAECLHLLAANHENLRQIICREGGIESLVLLLEKAPNTHVQEIALRAIHSLSESRYSRSLLMSSGFAKQLTILLKSGSSAIQESAASAICNLSQTDETKRALGEAGCIGLLAKMLDGKASSSQQTASRALSSLFDVDINRKEFIKDDDNVSCLVRLLDPQNETVTKTFPISALLSLSYSNRCKKKIVSAGACQYLKKLAEMEVVGAKKTLKKLAASRLRKIFSAKW